MLNEDAGFSLPDFLSGVGGKISETLESAYDLYEAQTLSRLFGEQQQQASDFAQGYIAPAGYSSNEQMQSVQKTENGFQIDTTALFLGGLILFGAVFIAVKK